jgi:type 1 glutamine amidotransferase
MSTCARALLVVAATAANAAPAWKALIIDGQNNHNWQATTPALKKLLEETGLFTVDVATSPPRGADLSAFRPSFGAYRVVVSNYNGESWPAATQADFENWVRAGGGFVVYHAANNPFREWKAFNEMIVLGGWGNRTPADGPYLRIRDGKPAREDKAGPSGHHGKRHAYVVTVRDRKHPVMAGLPEKWMHATDELYDSMRGPAVPVTVLATAFSDPATGGSGEDEPLILVKTYGKGRVFHTMLGHDLEAVSCIGFITTFQRGAEWAASGKVTQKAPPDFPGADAVRVRK